MEFKDIVRQLRKERGMTQQELADKIGLTTKVTISQYETGKRKPSFEMIEALADVFHVDMNYLLELPSWKPNTSIEVIPGYILLYIQL